MIWTVLEAEALGRLSATVRADATLDWLFTPNPLLANERPADLLRKGHWREVLGAIDQLAEGVFV